jgi:hypothetical protein
MIAGDEKRNCRPDQRGRRPPRCASLFSQILNLIDRREFEAAVHGTPAVLALFAHNPFPEKPPRYIRVVRYDYTLATAAGRARTGRWWDRTPTDFYVRPVSLR